MPKLVKGDERSDLQKNEYKPPPGMKEVRSADAGCDADKVFEALWEYQVGGCQAMREGCLLLTVLDRLIWRKGEGEREMTQIKIH